MTPNCDCGNEDRGRRPRVFVSGTYDSDRVILPRFNDARRRLDAAGLEAVQLAPHAESDPETGLLRLADDPIWMSDFREDMETCDGAALLDERSGTPGAVFEVNYARGLGLPVLPLEDWLDGSWRSAAHPADDPTREE